MFWGPIISVRRRKGSSRYSQVMKHALRNALLPSGDDRRAILGSLLAGAVLTETIFNLSGVGKILYDAITARDYIIGCQSFTVVIAIFFVVLNLIVDISYIYLDPRVRLD